MAEKSILWTAPTTGDGTAAYTESEVTRMFRSLVGGEPDTEGILFGVDDDLAVTGTGSPLSVGAGAAFVNGFFYWNTAAVNVAVSTPSIGTTGHRIVLQAVHADREVRIALLSSADGTASIPALTQSDGVQWEISLATLTITTGGVITVTDARGFCYFPTKVSTAMLDDSAVTEAKIGTGAVTAGKIGSGAVTESKIGTGAVTTTKIADGSVTAAKLDSGVLSSPRTRRFYVDGWRTTSSASPGEFGWDMSDGSPTTVYSGFAVPSDFSSAMTVYAILVPTGTGNLRYSFSAKYGADGQAYNAHTATTGSATEAVTADQWNLACALSLASAAVGDFVSLTFFRDGSNAIDTVGGNVQILGFLVEYTADM